MSWEDNVIEGLERTDVEMIVYLPDSTLWPLIEKLEDRDGFETVLVAREEEGVGILSGAWFGGRKGALICQASGLANTFNALGGLSKAWGLPFLGLISSRGNLGEHNLCQAPAGYGMPRLLDTLGIRNRSLNGYDDVSDCVSMAAQSAFSTEEPYVLMLENTLTGGK